MKKLLSKLSTKSKQAKEDKVTSQPSEHQFIHERNKLMVEQIINDRIGSDLWSHILQYVTPITALNLSLTCQELYELVFNTNLTICNTIWKQYILITDRTLSESDIDLNKNIDLKQDKITNYLEYFKKCCLMVFDVDDVSELSALKFSNFGRSVVSTRIRSDEERWELIHAKRKLTPGRIYEFEFIIDNINKLNTNVWMMVVGINRSDANYKRTCTTSFGPWLTHSTDGVGVIVYDGTILHNDSTSSTGSLVKNNDIRCVPNSIKNGDMIGFRVDMRNTTDTSGTVISIFLNGDFYTDKQLMTDLRGNSFYPAVSLMNEQAVTLRSGLTLNKC